MSILDKRRWYLIVALAASLAGLGAQLYFNHSLYLGLYSALVGDSRIAGISLENHIPDPLLATKYKKWYDMAAGEIIAAIVVAKNLAL
ncbi:MAG: hypothetical protein LBU64_07760 [Planctomycetota bacterium]|jgi:hypothetical protein|nr:hypothetical protein [Planctomycetota bacterium]